MYLILGMLLGGGLHTCGQFGAVESQYSIGVMSDRL